MALTLFSGYEDKNGTLINHGDIVEFYFDANCGHGDKSSGYTKMIDVCFFDKDDNEFYLISDYCCRRSFVWRHNKYCEVIGNIKRDKNLLSLFSEDSLSEMFPNIF